MVNIKKNNQSGFTIIELMIATSVLSVIILLATVVMINIGTTYYKGYNSSRIQDAVRTAIDQVTQDVKFSAGGNGNAVQNSQSNPGGIITPPGYSSITIEAYCIGDARYSYVIGGGSLQIGPASATQIPHMLWRDIIVKGSLCLPADLSQPDPESTSLPSKTILQGSNGQELVPPASRLNYFCVADDGSCISKPGGYVIDVNMIYGDPTLSPAGTCLGGSGDQFCAADTLISRVAVRPH